MDPNRLCLGCMREKEEQKEVCSQCGWDNHADNNKPHQLVAGTVLYGKYLIGKVLGEGGFGITYLGYDLVLQEKVAVKEFFPQGFVSRNHTVSTEVTSYSGQEPFFDKSKGGFIKEAQTMSKLHHMDGIVEMREAFEENKTVYIVMEYVEGETLKSYVKRNGNRLPMEEILRLLEPIMNALTEVHEKGLIHRDVSPDNIMLRSNGEAVLLDFGAARQISADGGHSLTVNVKHGYAPIEQYQTHGGQGPWTDVYALCATIYRLLTGEVPPSAADRVISECIKNPSEFGGKISPKQEEVLLKGLSVKAEGRYQTIGELQKAFSEPMKKKMPKKEPEVPKIKEEPKKEPPEEPTVPEKEKIYQVACELMGNSFYYLAKNRFSEIKGYKDAEQKMRYCEAFSEKKPSDEPEKSGAAPKKWLLPAIIGILGIAAIIAFGINLPGVKYKEAVRLMEQGQYEKAELIFERIKNYKDSEIYLNNCRNEDAYLIASTLYDEEKYKDAYDAFSALGDYSDSAERANDSKYMQAINYFDAAEYEEAITAFKKVSNYKDVPDRLPEAKYQYALILENERDWKNAYSLFKELKDYKDSSEKYKSTYYQYGISLLSNESYKDAVTVFSSLENYQESKTKLNEAKYRYVTEHKSRTDNTTYTYLEDLKSVKYKDSKDISSDLYSWTVTALLNNSETDDKTNRSSISKWDTVYCHFKLSGGSPNEGITLKATAFWPNGASDSYKFDGKWYDGSSGFYCCWYNEPAYSSTGTLRIRIYNNDTGELLNEFTVTLTD